MFWTTRVIPLVYIVSVTLLIERFLVVSSATTAPTTTVDTVTYRSISENLTSRIVIAVILGLALGICTGFSVCFWYRVCKGRKRDAAYREPYYDKNDLDSQGEPRKKYKPAKPGKKSILIVKRVIPETRVHSQPSQASSQVEERQPGYIVRETVREEEEPQQPITVISREEPQYVRQVIEEPRPIYTTDIPVTSYQAPQPVYRSEVYRPEWMQHELIN